MWEKGETELIFLTEKNHSKKHILQPELQKKTELQKLPELQKKVYHFCKIYQNCIKNLAFLQKGDNQICKNNLPFLQNSGWFCITILVIFAIPFFLQFWL